MLYSLIGCLITAIGVNLGYVPVHLFSTAFPGVGVLALYTIGISAGVVVFLLNVPLFMMAWKHFGKSFFFKNIIVTIALSVFLDLLYPVHQFVHPPLWLGILIGGICMGVGTGIIFRQGLTSGGVGLFARLVQLRFPNMKIGTFHIVFDFFVLAVGAILIDVKTALFTLIGSIIMGRTMDLTKDFKNPFLRNRSAVKESA